MKRFSKMLHSTITVFVLTFSILFFGNFGNVTHQASAEITVDEAKLCLLLSTPLDSDVVDMAAFLECLAELDNEGET